MIISQPLRLAVALAGATAVLLGVSLLPARAGSAAAPTHGHAPTPTASSSPGAGRTASGPAGSGSPGRTKKPKPKHHRHSGTTVVGPRLWNPATGSPLTKHSIVTVSQTKNLTNQMIQVSWSNFTPSGPAGVPGVYNQQLTTYPVMVAECNTLHPRFWDQCYGSNAGGIPGEGPYGPMNTSYATTSPNGTGQLDIQILVAAQNQFLNCGKYHPCSLIVIPAQGGNPPNCSDHTLDSLNALGSYDFGGQYGECSWNERIVVPLSFVQAPKLCPITNSNFTVLGSPMLNLAMTQWTAALCARANPIAITYNPTITEPEAIQDLGSGLGDVALTSRPGPAQTGGKKYVYAPVAISAVAIAYWIDSPTTFQPVTSLDLDPRLVAKLLTQSYNFDGDGCARGQAPRPGIGCDSAVDGNPPDLFADPEFHKLNPHVQTPLNATFQVPTVMSGHSDMTWEVTRWIASNRDANNFMLGQFDPWGMHLNSDYLSLRYPQDSFTGQDNYPVISHKYSPAFPLTAVVQIQAQNTDDGTDYEVDPTTGNYPKDPIEFPGARSLFAVVDEADAAALQFPVAKILNADNRYVGPNAKSMAAALSTMTPIGGNGVTQQVNFGKKRADAYPLTMVIYAMVPISGVSSKKAAAIADFLDYVVGPGQHHGLNVGQLPPGYLPLTSTLTAQALHAADEVRAQSGNPKPAKKSPSSSPSSSPSAGASSHGAGGSPSSSASPTPGSAPRIVTLTTKNAQTVGLARYALPALLILGGLAALGGASSLIASTVGTAILIPLRRLRRLRLTLRRKQ